MRLVPLKSGSGRALGPVCFCVPTIHFELNIDWPRYIAGWSILPMSRSVSKVDIIGQSSRS